MKGFGGRGIRNVWPVLFILGAVMLNRPFLNIFDVQRDISGIPLLFHFMIVGWLLSIGVIFFYRLALESSSDAEGD